MLFVLVITLASLAIPRAANVPGTAVYTGAYIQGETYDVGNPPWDIRALTEFETNAGKKLSILHWGQPWYWSNKGGYQAFDRENYEKLRQRGTTAMINWNSWDLAAGNAPDQPDFQLRDIIDGQHDTYLRQWARDAKAWGYPFLVRFNHEMNGTWYPWSEHKNGNSAGEFAIAWRHVVDIFRQESTTNATWVWCPVTVNPNTIPLASLYPGHAYVDWVCMDQYNYGTNPNRPGSAWRWFDTIFRATYKELLSLAPGKPIMIGETASSEYGGSKAEWIKDALLVQLPSRYPQVKAWVWFNWNHRTTNGYMDYVIESSDAAQTAYQRSIASSYYATNAFGDLPKMTKLLPLMPQTTPYKNPIQNPSFEPGADPWYLPWTMRNDLGAAFSADGTTDFDGTHSFRASIPRTNTAQPWVIQLRHRGIALQAGRSYTVSFAAKASSQRPISIVIQKSVSPYTEYFGQRVNLTVEWSRFTYRFTAPTNESSAMLAFNLALATGQVWIDDVSLGQF